jgi:hypothetical protein
MDPHQREESISFLKKKKQKTYIISVEYRRHGHRGTRIQTVKSFLVLFFKKAHLAFYLSSFARFPEPAGGKLAHSGHRLP